MDFGWRFRKPTDATTVRNPQTRCLITLDGAIRSVATLPSPCRGVGCADGGTDLQITAFEYSSSQLFQKLRLIGRYLISNGRNSDSGLCKLRRGEGPDSPLNRYP
jgi:hypothetical protein